jgi:hypothetical protein
MSVKYRIVMQYKNVSGVYEDKDIIDEGKVIRPETIIDIGLRHQKQIEILQAIQDSILNAQSIHLKEDLNGCPNCGNKLHKQGTTKASFNAVFTDHKVPVQRQICPQCKWRSVPSINSLFGTHMHPDLLKLQCENSSEKSYTKSEIDLNKMSNNIKRTVNNTMTQHGVIENVGAYISNHADLTVPDDIVEVKNLVVQVDGGHIKPIEKHVRSFEAMTSVIYNPDNVVPKAKKKKMSLEEFKKADKNLDRGEIIQKHCAASALDDGQEQMKKLTLIAAKKEGLTKNTEVTALSDGAQNCWNIIDSLNEECASIICILDWFHIAMKFQTISLSESHKELLDSGKWALWHGNIDLSIDRLTELKKLIRSVKNRDKVGKLITYISNNTNKIVDYNDRKKKGLIFTSNMAECTVESLINQRCKGKQHMRWTREGVHSILQIRASKASNDWSLNWQNYILGAYTKAA